MKRFGVVVFVGFCFLAGGLLVSPMSFAADEPPAEEVILPESEVGEAAVEGEAAAEETATEEPAAEETATEEPAAEETATEEPAAEETATEEPAAEETATEEPAAEETATEEPAAEETATEEPAAEETAAEEPAAEETAAEEPAAEEMAAEEPAAEEMAAEEPAAEEMAAEEPAAEEAAAAGAAAAATEEPAAEEQAEEAEKTPAGKAELKDSLEGSTEAVGAISASINELSSQQKGDGGDLEGVFNKFQADLKTFQEKNESLGVTYGEMKGNMESSLDAWKTELGSISNEKIRKSGEKRQASSLKSFETLVKEMEVINKDLSSLAGILGDVESYLTFDLTPAGIGELSTSLKDATKKVDTIQKNITGIQGTLSNLPEVQRVQTGQ
jgi:chemotaxis protein histidine kinase CheA